MIIGIPRHCLFGDITDSNKLFMVPEADCSFEIIKKTNSKEIAVKFRGQRVVLPAGTAVQFIQLQAVTASGGIGFPEPEPEPARSAILSLTPKGSS